MEVKLAESVDLAIDRQCSPLLGRGLDRMTVVDQRIRHPIQDEVQTAEPRIQNHGVNIDRGLVSRWRWSASRKVTFEIGPIPWAGISVVGEFMLGGCGYTTADTHRKGSY